MSETSISRRDLFTRSRDIGGLATLAALLTGRAEGAGDGGARDVYTSIGVRPFINARGTYTILSGSTMLPEVRAAMDQAARQYVHLDELTDAIGARLAALTSAEWGLVTSGCAAALTHATAACVAGGNPDLHVRMPDLRGFAKDEVIIPRHSRNVYDAAIRAVGVRVIEASTLAELEAALGPRTAMVYVLAGPEADKSQLTVAAMAPLTRPRGVPILVDAAAEILTIPNIHLQNGATLVGYSGGKCLRGPQTAGLLLGRKDLVKAAWVHSAPHHGFARAMKVGKEEAIGMLAAVEQWVRRDHDAEWRQWTAWLDEIAQRVKTVEGIGLTTEVTQPAGLSNRTPSLRITWDREALGTTGDARRTDAVSNRAAHLAVPRPEQRRGANRRLHHAVHDGAGRRGGCGRSPPCRVVHQGVTGSHAASRGGKRRRCLGDLDRHGGLRGVRGHAHAASAPAWQYNRRQPSGRLHQPRADRHHRRPTSGRPVVLRRRARRRVELSVHGHD